jgi:NNP family nitrate/nitrite transporter-like MFS transporter
LTQPSRSKYKWFILILAALTHSFGLALPWGSMPVLFQEISQDLNLSLVQLGFTWGGLSLAGIFVVFIGGVLGDRFGVKRILFAACILAGLAGALRGLTDSFTTFTAATLLFGLLAASIVPNVHKTCSIWFSGRQLGLANGVAAMGMAAGFMVGTMISATTLSPWLDGWRNVLFLYGALSILIAIPWLFTRNPKASEVPASHVKEVPFREAISRVIRIRQVWLLGIVLLCQGGSIQGMLGYLPLYLRELDWSITGADGTSAAFHAASMLGVIPITMFSDWLDRRRIIVLVSTLISALGIGILLFADGTVVWLAVIFSGMVRDGFMAIHITMTMETDGVGPRYAGTAIGLTQTLARIGMFALPPIGNGLAAISPDLPFLFWAAMPALSLLCFFLIKDTSKKRLLPAAG